MIELTNNTSLQINKEFLNDIASFLSKKDIELYIVDKEEMLRINQEQRAVTKETDVLSFPYEEMPMAPLGSIVICDAFVYSKSQELKHSQNDEFALLFIHGMLHLIGFDHETDDGEMRSKENELIAKFHLPKSLIVRAQG